MWRREATVQSSVPFSGVWSFSMVRVTPYAAAAASMSSITDLATSLTSPWLNFTFVTPMRRASSRKPAKPGFTAPSMVSDSGTE